MRAAIFGLTVCLSVSSAAPVQAQHSGQLAHGEMASGTEQTLQSRPLEPGNGAFAAISEIVAMLEEDSSTNWSRVDIDGLREHLVDMNALALGAEIVMEAMEGACG